MKRPIIEIERSGVDKALDAMGFISIVLMFFIAAKSFGQLPDQIPIHFKFDGTPDGFSSKNSIWILPIIGLFSFLLLFFLNKKPHIFNYPQKVTEANAQRLYTDATKMIRWLNISISLMFLFLVHQTIQTALGRQSGLKPWFLSVFLIAILGISFWGLHKSMKNK